MRIACISCDELNSDFNVNCSRCGAFLPASSERAATVIKQSLRPREGDIVGGRYRLDRLLGQGGMGSVFAATHRVTGKSWALKFIKEALATESTARRRFLREARLASLLEHPNVIAVSDVFEEDGLLVMVMDLLQGETLRCKLDREGALSVLEVATLFSPVVSAIGTAHARGIVHRDLKPENVFLSKAGDRAARVRVLDFGIAKIWSQKEGATPSITTTGAMIGTPVYMSPEQCFGERDIDQRADIWTIGVMLYEALSGKRPIVGENLGEVLKSLLNATFVPLEVSAPHVPAALADLVSRMLAKDRAERPSDLRGVAEVLARHTDLVVPGFDAPMRAEKEPPEDLDPPALLPTASTVRPSNAFFAGKRLPLLAAGILSLATGAALLRVVAPPGSLPPSSAASTSTAVVPIRETAPSITQPVQTSHVADPPPTTTLGLSASTLGLSASRLDDAPPRSRPQTTRASAPPKAMPAPSVAAAPAADVSARVNLGF